MPTDPVLTSRPFTTCRLCGEANPPGRTTCRICGKEGLLATGEAPSLPRRERRWYRFVRFGRIAAVLAVAAGLAFVLLQGAITPAPVAADPLTQSSTQTAPAGGYTEISGAITGGDYIQGNYTVMSPPGALLTLTVYNDSEYSNFVRGQPTDSQEAMSESAQSEFAFDAPYTNTYHFVWVNHYPTLSGLSLRFYVQTAYEPNVVIA